jgi:hypothetical protein
MRSSSNPVTSACAPARVRLSERPHARWPRSGLHRPPEQLVAAPQVSGQAAWFSSSSPGSQVTSGSGGRERWGPSSYRTSSTVVFRPQWRLHAIVAASCAGMPGARRSGQLGHRLLIGGDRLLESVAERHTNHADALDDQACASGQKHELMLHAQPGKPLLTAAKQDEAR